MDEYTNSLLRPDNYELFDKVRDRLNLRPVEPIASIAFDLGVTVDDLCRWVIGFREKKAKSPYQSPAFAPIGPPRTKGGNLWTATDALQRQKIAQKARDGARAAREAMEKDHA